MNEKAQSNPENRRIGMFLIPTLIIAALLMITPITILYRVSHMHDEQIKDEIERSSQFMQHTIRSFMDGAYNLSYELASNPSILTMDTAIQTPILEQSVARNPYLELLYIQGMDGMQTARSEGELADRRERWWFVQMAQERVSFVSASYLSIATNMPTTSVFFPMFDGYEMIGIFGADIRLDYIQQLMLQFAVPETGKYSFIIDGSGVLLAHPDSALLETLPNFSARTQEIPRLDSGGSPIWEAGNIVTDEVFFDVPDDLVAVVNRVMIGNSGVDIIEMGSSVYYVSYEPIRLPGYSDSWSVVTLQSRTLAMGAVYELVIFTVFITVLIFIVFSICMYRFSNSLKRTLEALKGSFDREQAASAAKTKFLSNMSHEIRTPMNSVLGITELQLQKDTHPPETEEAFRRIYTSSTLLISIINDILDLSKVEADKMEIIPVAYEMASMISDTIQLNLMHIGSKIIKFKLRVDEWLPARLIGDELRIKQILNNLLSNAFKYTVEGVVSLSLEMEAATGDDMTLIIKVRDTGQGMTEKQVAELFRDEFTRFNTQENRAIEGSGLGLVITDRLIRMMSGEISVESQPGIGSTFTVTLPQKMIDGDILGKKTADKLQDLESFQQSIKRVDKLDHEPMPYGSVLVVDDVESNLYVAKIFLMPYKIAIDTAESGEIAISKVRDGQVYDIIFMDYMMPGMDGMEATKRLRDMGYEHPIVALTADAVVGQADVLLSNGFDDYISKPIDIRQLNEVLNKFVRNKQPPEVLEAARAQAAEAQAAGKELNEPTEGHASSGLLSGKEIDGLDIGKGLERYDSNEEIYLKILQAYLHSMRSMIEPIEAFDQANLIDYKIKVHGVSGASFDIFAADIGTAAKALEKAAIDGDIDYINTHNAPFISDLRRLLDDVDGMLASVNAEKPKADAPVKDKPDADLIEALINACNVYDMNTVDDVVAEIEKYQYESDPGLAGWLRENADAMNFSQIADRLNDILSQITNSPAVFDEDFETLADLTTDQLSGLLLEPFIRDARKAIVALDDMCCENGLRNESDLRNFTVLLHGMRSSLHNIGENDMSERAKKLEEAGRSEDIGLINAHAWKFLTDLRSLLDRLDIRDDVGEHGGSIEAVHGNLQSIKEMCADYNRKGVLDLIGRTQSNSDRTAKVLSEIKELVIYSNFEEAEALTQAHIDELSEAKDPG